MAAIPIIIYSVLYIGGMLTVGRWLLGFLSDYYDRTGKLSQLMLAAIYMAVVASALGWLMNTRGLTEPSVLNIGLELGVISPILVNPLSPIELEEDYLFQSTPFEANRPIDRRIQQLNESIDTLELLPQSSATSAMFQSIVQIGYDVSQKTAVIAALDRASIQSV